MLFGGRALGNGTRRPDGSVRGIVLERRTADLPDVNCGNERRPMSAEILKRKLRNFPVASLSIRIASS
jgi:hypothetical protein